MIIWLASYPRSGNTFLRVLLNSIFNLKTCSLYGDTRDIAADSATADVVGHEELPEDFNLDEARTSDRIYLLKTHDYPPNSQDKAIYLVRDGRECVLSYLKYQNAYHGGETRFLDVVFGNVPFGAWGDHLAAWDPAHRDNTLLLRFEDLIDEPEACVSEISGFIGVQPEGDSIPSFADLNRVNPKFFRAGKKQSWKESFPAAALDSFMLRNEAVLRQYGYAEGHRVPESLEDSQLLARQLLEEIEYLQHTVPLRLQEESDRQEAKISEQGKRLGEKTAQIDMLEQALETKEQKKQQLAGDLDESRKHVRQLKQQRDAGVEKIRKLEGQLVASDQELENIRKSARQLLDELQLIRSSRRYRLAEAIARPVGVLRRKPRK